MNPSREKKDQPKHTLIYGKVLLSLNFLWPEQSALFTNVWLGIEVFMFLFLQWGEFSYVVNNLSSPDEMGNAMSTIATNFQVIFKILTIRRYSKRLADMLKSVRNDFWRSDLFGAETEKDIKKFSNMLLIHFTSIMMLGGIAMSSLTIGAIMAGSRQLPLRADFPVNYSSTPVYVALVTWELGLYGFALVTSAIGYDMFFLSLCNNVIAQLHLLQLAFAHFGEREVVSEEFKNFFDITEINNGEGKYMDYSKMVKKCVRHHVRLLKFVEEIEEIFNFPNMIQLICTVIAVCFSTFLFTIFETVETSMLIFLLFYLVAHLLQLFTFCAAGTEITYKASLIADSIVASKWYEYPDETVRKDLLIIMTQVSASLPKISAFRMFIIHYQIFVQVLKLSFSFRTFLSQVSIDK